MRKNHLFVYLLNKYIMLNLYDYHDVWQFEIWNHFIRRSFLTFSTWWAKVQGRGSKEMQREGTTNDCGIFMLKFIDHINQGTPISRLYKIIKLIERRLVQHCWSSMSTIVVRGLWPLCSGQCIQYSFCSNRKYILDECIELYSTVKTT